MVSAICKAKNKETCPYHGSVIRLHKIEAAMVKYVNENNSMSNELLEQYIVEKNNIVAREREGWTEEDYVEKLNSTSPATTSKQPGVYNPPLVRQYIKADGTPGIYPSDLVKSAVEAVELRPYEGPTKEEKFGNLTGIPEETLKELIDGKHPITPSIANKLAKVSGTETGWLKEARDYSAWALENKLYSKLYPGHESYIPGNMSEELQNGEVVPQMIYVDPDYPEDTGTEFFLRTKDNYPIEPYQIRIQASRPLDAADVQRMAQLLGYSYRSNVRGESLGDPHQDTPYSFVVFADTTKGRTDDIGYALEKLETEYPRMLREGSPQRKTMNNTRLVEGLDDSDFDVHFYYDSVGAPRED